MNAGGPTSPDVRQQLRSLPLRYNRPPDISFDHDTPVSLVIELAGKGSGAGALADFAGTQVSAAAWLSHVVRATLTGPPDEVTVTQADPPSTRHLLDGVNAQWIWHVRAKKPGSTTLTLELNTTVMDDGVQTPVQITTYTDKFRVKMSVWSWAKWQIDQIQPVWKFLGLGTPIAILGGAAAWIAARRRRRAGAPI